MALVVSLDSNQTVEEQQLALEVALNDGYEVVDQVEAKAKVNRTPGRRSTADGLSEDVLLEVVHVIMKKRPH